MPEVVSRRKLSDREWAFLIEYLGNGRNATRAYQAVYPNSGYAAARVGASRLLTKANIRAEVKRQTRRLERRAGVDAGRVLREWEALAFSDLGEVIDFEARALRRHLHPTARKGIATIECVTTVTGETTRTTLKVRMHPKADALDKLSRHLGLYKDRPALEQVLALLPQTLRATVEAELLKATDSGRQPPSPAPEEPAARLEHDPAVD